MRSGCVSHGQGKGGMDGHWYCLRLGWGPLEIRWCWEDLACGWRCSLFWTVLSRRTAAVLRLRKSRGLGFWVLPNSLDEPFVHIAFCLFCYFLSEFAVEAVAVCSGSSYTGASCRSCAAVPVPISDRTDLRENKTAYAKSLLRSHKFPNVPRSLLPHGLLLYTGSCRYFQVVKCARGCLWQKGGGSCRT